MDILLTVHSLLRWFIILIAALAIFKFSVSWAGNSAFKGMDRGLASALSGLMDAQVLLGFIYFLWDGFTGAGFPGTRWLHMLIMIVAAGLMHVPARLNVAGRQAALQLFDRVHSCRADPGVHWSPGIEIMGDGYATGIPRLHLPVPHG